MVSRVGGVLGPYALQSALLPLRPVARYRVLFADCDPMRIMYYASYFRLFEIGRAMRVWVPRQRHLFAGLGTPLTPDMAVFLHDPLALACAHDESFCRIEELPIEPVTVDGVFRTFERAPGTPGAFPMRCATAVDAARFTAHVRHRLGLVA